MEDELFSQQMPAHEPCVNGIILSSSDDEDVPLQVDEAVVEPANAPVVRFANRAATTAAERQRNTANGKKTLPVETVKKVQWHQNRMGVCNCA